MKIDLTDLRSIAPTFLFCLLCNIALPQDSLTFDSDRRFVESYVVFDEVKTKHISCVRLYRMNSSEESTILSTLRTSKLELRFDDLRGDFNEYRYAFVHCNSSWEIYRETEMNYVEINDSRYVEDVQFSSATATAFASYTVAFPKDGNRFIRSGNFAIQIIDVETDSVIITKRFTVIDPQLNINARVKKTDEVKYQNFKQQLSFEISDPKNKIKDVNGLRVVALKNRSWEITCSDFKPSFVSGNKIIFDYTSNCLFDGGNEYRYFNTLESRSFSSNIIRVSPSKKAAFDIYLETDEPRSFLKYSNMQDMNGRTLYKAESRSISWHELDYSFVHFSLNTEQPMLGFELYLFGEFTMMKMDSAFRMDYNPSLGRYEKTLLLKHGFYNYQYVVKSPYQDGPDEAIIEGSHAETENDYTIFVYYSSMSEGYDQLLGVAHINSSKNE
ncbi:MAG: DUF5103 domain-containing protein [Vicingaceae bacterium]